MPSSLAMSPTYNNLNHPWTTQTSPITIISSSSFVYQSTPPAQHGTQGSVKQRRGRHDLCRSSGRGGDAAGSRRGGGQVLTAGASSCCCEPEAVLRVRLLQARVHHGAGARRPHEHPPPRPGQAVASGPRLAGRHHLRVPERRVL